MRLNKFRLSAQSNQIPIVLRTRGLETVNYFGGIDNWIPIEHTAARETYIITESGDRSVEPKQTVAINNFQNSLIRNSIRQFKSVLFITPKVPFEGLLS